MCIAISHPREFAMTYDRFESLPVWQLAADAAAKMFVWTAHPWFRGKGDLANQMQRAMRSVSNNIAEGFERGSKSELLQFLYYARGSAGEVRSMLGVMERMGDVEPLRPEILQFKSQCERIGKQIFGWTQSLQNSQVPGQRYLNEKSQKEFEQNRRRDEFAKSIKEATEKAHQERLARERQSRQDSSPGSES